MKTVMVSAKKESDVNKIYSVPFDTPETIEEGTKLWGADVLLSNAIANAVVWFQGRIRAAMTKGLTNDEASAQLKGSKPGVAAALKADPEKVLMEKAKADPEYRKKLIALLQAEAKAK